MSDYWNTYKYLPLRNC